jgi:PGF-CTERM protein
MKRLATALTVLVLTASIAPATTASIASSTARQSSGQAYAGTHVSFDASQRAVTDYAVHGETMLDSVKVESQSSAESSGPVSVGASLSAVTQLDGAGLNVGATTRTEARVRAENGATIAAHDNGRGILVVEPGDQSDYVVANLSAGASAAAESDSQVEVTTANGTNGTFLVVGEGNVTVNDDGDVSAHLGEDGRLAFRAYPDGKDDGDDQQERLIADGRAKAEAYVMADGGETVVDTVSYGANTTVETAASAEGAVNVTVNRTTHEGTILLTSVSDEALNATENLTVSVDGEAAVEAAAYSQLESAIGSEQSRYVVEGGGEASAGADVLVAVNHFSERTVTMSSSDADGSAADETTTADGGETTTDAAAGDETTADSDGGDGGVPGFTATTAIVALLAAALIVRLR